MAKLTIPTLPSFSTVLPSNGKTVSFRPITVREESFLLMAKESGSPADMLAALKGIIGSCVEYPITKMALVDIEWLFIQIRAKSVSEEVALSYRCISENKENGKTCGAQFESYINLNDIVIKGEPTISLTLTFLSGTYVLHFNQPMFIDDQLDEAKKLYKMVDRIEDPSGDIVTQDDMSSEEFDEFLATFTGAQMDQLKAALETIGSVYYKNILTCPVCGTVTEVEYKSLLDFFS